MKPRVVFTVTALLVAAIVLFFAEAEGWDNRHTGYGPETEEAVILNVSGKPRVAVFFSLGYPLYARHRHYYRRYYCPYGGYYRYYNGRRYYYCYGYPRKHYYKRYYR